MITAVFIFLIAALVGLTVYMLWTEILRAAAHRVDFDLRVQEAEHSREPVLDGSNEGQR